MGPIEYAATHASIANLGNSNWTVAGDNYCHGHGFAAEVCKYGGWGHDRSAWAYQCGKAPASSKTIDRSLSRFIFGGLVSDWPGHQRMCSRLELCENSNPRAASSSPRHHHD